MNSALARFLRTEFPPPFLMNPSVAGIDISHSGIKAVHVAEAKEGRVVNTFAEELFDPDVIGEEGIKEPKKVVFALARLKEKMRISQAYVSLPESRGYLFETAVENGTMEEKRTAIESKLDEYVPLPPSDVAFDFTTLECSPQTERVVGVGYSKKLIQETLDLFDGAEIEIRALESENFALPRALLTKENTETVLIIDIGRTTTKLLFVTGRIPRYATTLTLGGHAFTIAVQKYFGVSEEEAKEIKAQRGIVQSKGNEEYVSAMLSTVSVMKDEIQTRLSYWNNPENEEQARTSVSRAIIVGGNASLRGLPEYFESIFGIPFTLGDVFANFAERELWLPPLEFMQSLAYGTAIGLSLREFETE